MIHLGWAQKTRVEPHNASGAFAFSGDLGGFTLNGSDERTSGLLFAGTYAVTMAPPPAHFTLTGLSCDDGGSATPGRTEKHRPWAWPCP